MFRNEGNIRLCILHLLVQIPCAALLVHPMHFFGTCTANALPKDCSDTLKAHLPHTYAALSEIRENSLLLCCQIHMAVHATRTV